MKIGIGLITYNRPKHLELWKKQIEFSCNLGRKRLFTSENGICYINSADHNYCIFITDDSHDRKGVAFRSNECLRALKDCDYIFLFNDDCFPVKEGWADFFINASLISQQQHFLYLKETTNTKKIDTKYFSNGHGAYSISAYNNCGGCFMFLTREVIERVGGFCMDYGFYGFEHAGYSMRIHQAGLTMMGDFLSPEGAGEYIYAMDYDFHLPYNKQLNHASSMPAREMLSEIKKNEKIFKKDIEIIYQPL